MSSDPTPLAICHADTYVVSFLDIPWVTVVHHCGFKYCTRDISLTICRSIGGRTTAYTWREETVTTWLVDRMQAHAIQHKQEGMQNVHMSTLAQSRKHIHICKITHEIRHVNTCRHRTHECRHGAGTYLHVPGTHTDMLLCPTSLGHALGREASTIVHIMHRCEIFSKHYRRLSVQSLHEFVE